MPSVTVALAVLALAGCAERIPTQVIVRVDADEATRTRASTVRVQVWGRGEEPGSPEIERLSRTVDVSGGDAETAFPLVIPVLPSDGEADRRFVVLVSALDDAGVAFVSRRVRSGYVRDRRTEIRVALELACHDLPECDAAHTCIAGACDHACVEPSAANMAGASPPVPCTDVPDAGADLDAGPADTGPPMKPDTGAVPDAGAPDAAIPECVDAEDCLCATATCESSSCVPTPELRVASVTTGTVHTCAVLRDGSRACAGANNSMRLGLGLGATSVNVMTRPSTPEVVGYVSLSGGTDFTCGIRLDGELVCFGRNNFGQLGNGDDAITESGTPAPIAITRPASGWARVSAGATHACALDGEGALYCWGRNNAGQLGLGTADTLPHATPTTLPGTRRYSEVGLGGGHSCAIAVDESLWCWGTGASGRLGLGSSTNQRTPMMVGMMDEYRWRKVHAGSAHTCGITTGGALYCWGSGTFAQLGDGTTDSHLVPNRVGTRSDWLAVAPGNQHTCGLAGTGELYCWGQNDLCQLGLPRATASVALPESIGGRTDWIALGAGSGHTCAIDGTGALRCWGAHNNGQVGAGPPPPNEICGARYVCIPAAE